MSICVNVCLYVSLCQCRRTCFSRAVRIQRCTEATVRLRPSTETPCIDFLTITLSTQLDKTARLLLFTRWYRNRLSTSPPCSSSSSYPSLFSLQFLPPCCRSLSASAALLTPIESLRRHQQLFHETFSQRLNFSTTSSSFDIFQKLKDPPEDKGDSTDAASLKKRKPSDRVSCMEREKSKERS